MITTTTDFVTEEKIMTTCRPVIASSNIFASVVYEETTTTAAAAATDNLSEFREFIVPRMNEMNAILVNVKQNKNDVEFVCHHANRIYSIGREIRIWIFKHGGSSFIIPEGSLAPFLSLKEENSIRKCALYCDKYEDSLDCGLRFIDTEEETKKQILYRQFYFSSCYYLLPVRLAFAIILEFKFITFTPFYSPKYGNLPVGETHFCHHDYFHARLAIMWFTKEPLFPHQQKELRFKRLSVKSDKLPYITENLEPRYEGVFEVEEKRH
jgi:hypothetical protein